MPFGLTNAPAAFQRMINNVLQEHLDIFVVCYLDDILIFSETEEEHTEHIHKVLRTLQDANLLVELEKSKFHASEVEFLGHIISRNEIRMDPKKIAAVKDWKEPTNVKEVQDFLGFANYYRRFLKRFGKIAAPLTDLTKKDKPFVMGNKAREAFNEIKELILSEPVLKMFDPSRPIELETDASDFALGAQIGQRGYYIQSRSILTNYTEQNPTIPSTTKNSSQSSMPSRNSDTTSSEAPTRSRCTPFIRTSPTSRQPNNSTDDNYNTPNISPHSTTKSSTSRERRTAGPMQSADDPT
ncbi:hypothetical protein MRS44_013727 [Fusarium solani]|uniref:uncharacterized protein n=1 Tax=Fusarium solani TaxID=169388 RepID=UPI0032C40264|nr:hypothetical protein MRS44_013727 [Fusarium solani]